MSDEEILAGMKRELAGVAKCDMDHEEPEDAVGVTHLVCPHCEAEWAILVCRRHRSVLMLLRTMYGELACGVCSGPIPAQTHTMTEKL